MHHVTYLINEIYPCLQGEGPCLGTPSVLVRLQICNLRCTWCDTPYTHTFKSDDGKFKRLSLQEIFEEIKKQNGIKHVVISGGEPLLQPVHYLLRLLKSKNYSIEIETNATRVPHVDLPEFKSEDYDFVQWNLSPKGNNAGEKIVEDALKNWTEISEEKLCYFKFVVRKNHAKQDLDELLALQKKWRWPSPKIILMAEGTSVESQTQNAWLEEICLQYGFRYSPRLHILNHGSQRGH